VQETTNDVMSMTGGSRPLGWSRVQETPGKRSTESRDSRLSPKISAVRGGAATRGPKEPEYVIGSLVDVCGRLPLVCTGAGRVRQSLGLALGHEKDVCIVRVRDDEVVLANWVAHGFVPQFLMGTF
jgi:hypothetical protein